MLRAVGHRKPTRGTRRDFARIPLCFRAALADLSEEASGNMTSRRDMGVEHPVQCSNESVTRESQPIPKNKYSIKSYQMHTYTESICTDKKVTLENSAIIE